MHAHLAGGVGQDVVAVVQLDTEHRVGEGLDDGPLQDDRIFLGFRQGGLLLHVLSRWLAGDAWERADCAESRLNMLARTSTQANSALGTAGAAPSPTDAGCRGRCHRSASPVADRAFG